MKRRRTLTSRAIIAVSALTFCAWSSQASAEPSGQTSGPSRHMRAVQETPATSAGAPIARGATAGPLRVSRHNPRYLARPDGSVVLLAGSHTWSNLQDNGTTYPPRQFDYPAYLEFLASYGHNFFRLWAWEQARWDVSGPEDKNWVWPSVYERTGPGSALDGLPRFDLTKFNQAYFDRIRQRVRLAGARGMYVSIMLFNGFSVTRSKPSSPPGHMNPWRGHPFHPANNINRINGDINRDESGEETHELRIPSITALQEAYVRKVIDTVNDLDNVLYEISNESHRGSQQWQYHMIRFIEQYQLTKPQRHPIGMTVPWPDGGNSALFSSPADWVSPNGSIANRPPADGTKVIVADTDHLCGRCGDAPWVWRSFTAGENPVFMDPYIRSTYVSGGPDQRDVDELQWEAVRRNLGYVVELSRRIDLRRMVPAPHLSSSGHCLADVGGTKPVYVVYLGGKRKVTVDLSRSPKGTVLAIEWLDIRTGRSAAGGTTSGGTVQTFDSPLAGDGVLVIEARGTTTWTAELAR